MNEYGNRNLRNIFSALMLLVLASAAQAAVDPLTFESADQESRFKSLVMELRCPKCQNQAIGDSDAPIAQDMRLKVHELMLGGETDEGIIQWLEARYGTYIRYKPRFGGETLWLWLIPPILLAVGGWIGFRVLRSGQGLSEQDKATADQLLDGKL